MLAIVDYKQTHLEQFRPKNDEFTILTILVRYHISECIWLG